MAGSSTKTIVDPSVGRLPAPVIEWPISESRFRSLAEQWRSANLWLSLWNVGGDCVAFDKNAGLFWETLRASRNGFSRDVEACAAQTMGRQGCSETGMDSDPIEFGAWPGDLGLIGIPIRCRRRCIGAVVAAFARTNEPGDDFARLSDQCGVGRAAMIRLLGGLGTIPNERVSETAGLLSFTIEQTREIEESGEATVMLTANLEHTYEELHLIYEISRQMGIPQKPARMLESVGREVLEVSRAAGIAFILQSEELLAHFDSDGEPGPLSRLEDSVVRIGPAVPGLEEVVRLTGVLMESFDFHADQLLLNEAAKHAELEWASDWLKHLLVLPLQLEGRCFGKFYALNCVDEGDYTSVDVQLLRAVADRIAAAIQNQRLYDDLADLLMGLLHAMVNSVDAKDPYTFGHSERVAYYSRGLAQAAGMSPAECERVYLAGLLHDVGKIGVPDAVLCKPGKLTKEEFDELKKHPEIGERILSHVRQIRDLLPGVLYHHERMDGRGYPHGLAGKDIPLLGRVICLADSFDAMTTNRTYRSAMPVVAAMAEIRRCAGNQFDSPLAEKFLNAGPQRLFEEAHACSRGDPNIGRIGAFCSALSLQSPPR